MGWRCLAAPAIAAGMHVAHLSLSNFRNHADSCITPGPGLNLLAGPNGAGKTNILEAVSLLAPGRGLRGAALADMIRAGGASGFAVSARCRAEDFALDEIIIGTSVTAEAPGRRRVRINGGDAAASSMAEWLSILWLTPAMDRLFVDAAGQRRRFLDRLTLALMPGHGLHANRYEAALRARMRLLTTDGPAADSAWLDALEAQLVEHGVAVDTARHRLIRLLNDVLAEIAPSPFARPQLALLRADGLVASGWTREALQAALHAGRGRDAAAGRALAGPHRIDVSVSHADTGQAAARCSTGEQKALLLSIILAHGDLVAAQRGQRPILLLDELAAHLDPERRHALFARLEAGGGQVWMTGTEHPLFADLPPSARRWTVREGQIREQN